MFKYRRAIDFVLVLSKFASREITNATKLVINEYETEKGRLDCELNLAPTNINDTHSALVETTHKRKKTKNLFEPSRSGKTKGRRNIFSPVGIGAGEKLKVHKINFLNSRD